ncbi:30S ribosomal protein S12 methylthiotransferase RimO [Pampinifervens florentissimum]|uniref:30S ribosomal protein S12 methylthiotransferase RimO n=1 Tax=Pampinifervens florentissimum TaxID=1632019 RepID=UPI0013B4920F|nr:30S ribosomal protein S12 methylthiotransferase RimO [Hydrogenobacter sp. T-8]QID32555.1 30S ribosomal protein S12 methylthiotransferase RimO [Hydrogenobacter sp. T-8]
MKVGVISLGCAKNLVDTEVLLGKLKEGGAKLLSDPKKADVIVINTCGFIEPAKREAIETILEFVEDKKVIVMGCLVQRYKEELQKEIPEVLAYFGTESWDSVVEFLGLEKKEKTQRVLTTPKSYAYLKIAEGCNRLCSFCAIPLIRGKHRSRPIEEILEEARYLASQGVKELCIVSQDTTYYGRDLYGRGYLIRLLNELERVEGIRWIRLLYLYPTEIEDDLLDYMQSSEKVLPYFDMPLQHISSKVLRSMRRGYEEGFVRGLIEKVRTKLPQAVLRTTFIVGYPTEEEEDFQRLLDFVSEGHFHWVGVFTYYQEEGTHAFSLGDPLSEKEKERRREELLRVQEGITLKKNQEFIGKELELLIDGYDEEFGYVPVGRIYAQAPEVDGITYVESERELKPGDMIRVKITQAGGYDLGAVELES